MKNSLSIIITLAILLSGSSKASLDRMLEKLAKHESSDMNINPGDRSSMCRHLDALIANNKAMPEAWVPEPCCEQEALLKETMEMLDDHDLRYYLSQFEDCGEVAGKLLILKDHEFYHYILLPNSNGT
ncbi:MAG: hypothetical protein QS748_06490 [Candidatus Endonucleobacter bathymodioli]|uniref:Uncharacterized protein n=1 Tax=Candidatus Endonucleibacter bathymodioli TaxID=539814 RepID=A0AA90NQS2_9GAMM|nr:hypothetical protein [Candidatus Endonucleobacter bathymodioli]